MNAHFAIIGRGAAGLSLAYHLLREGAKRRERIQLDVYDAFEIGSGATGVAAGLIHPFSPSGKVLWQGLTAHHHAERLIQAAQAHSTEVFWRRSALYRPAISEKQKKQFSKHIGWGRPDRILDASCVSVETTAALCDAVDPGFDTAPQGEGHISGFYVPYGNVIDTKVYLQSLWNLCHHVADDQGSSITLHPERVEFLEDLERQQAYDAIAVATGAAINEIKELQGMFELDLCQGYTVDITAPDPKSCNERDISLLGNPYVAFLNNDRAIVGATQQHGVSSYDAYNALNFRNGVASKDALNASEDLLNKARHILPSLRDWNVAQIRSGVRALPTRTSIGSIPYAGKISRDRESKQSPSWWNVCGLGARGLVYHAWLGSLVAFAMFQQEDSSIPVELKRWKRVKPN